MLGTLTVLALNLAGQEELEAGPVFATIRLQSTEGSVVLEIRRNQRFAFFSSVQLVRKLKKLSCFVTFFLMLKLKYVFLFP